MDANAARLPKVLNSSVLVKVPFFQRAYVWDKDLWEQLLKDMEYVTEASENGLEATHFLGPLILKDSGLPQEEEKVSSSYNLIDGQQRLTTFLILLKVLCLKSGLDSDFDRAFRLSDGRMCLEHSKTDSIAFNRVMGQKTPEKIEDDNPSRIIQAFNYYIDNLDEKKLKYWKILNGAEFVDITLHKTEDEQQIFDSLNSLGVKLSTSELLKNYLFSKNNIKDYQSKWEWVFERDEDTRDYWDSLVGRSGRPMIDVFFHAFFQNLLNSVSKRNQLTIDEIDRDTYDKVERLARSFQHFIKKYCDGDKQIVVDQISDYATVYEKNFQPKIYCNNDLPVLTKFSIERLNLLIFGLQTTTLIPYVLYLAKNVENPQDLEGMCQILETFIIRRMMVNATTRHYNIIFKSLIANGVKTVGDLHFRLLKNESESMYVPNDKELEQAFLSRRMTNIQAQVLLYLIETKIRSSNKKATLLRGFNQYSIEHMMPKNWQRNWLMPNMDEEAIRFRNAKIYTMGNLAIIPVSLNSSLRDAGWPVKKEKLKEYASGISTFFNSLEQPNWNEDTINERGLKLYNLAKEIWKIKD